MSTSSTCLSRVSLSTLMVTILSCSATMFRLRDITGVFPVVTDNTLVLLLLLDNVLDLEWRLPLLKLKVFLMEDKVELRPSKVEVLEDKEPV